MRQINEERLQKLKELVTALEYEKSQRRAQGKEAMSLKIRIINTMNYYDIHYNIHNLNMLGYCKVITFKINSVDRFITEYEIDKLMKWSEKNRADGYYNDISQRQAFENMSFEDFLKITK